MLVARSTDYTEPRLIPRVFWTRPVRNRVQCVAEMRKGIIAIPLAATGLVRELRSYRRVYL